MSSKFSMPPDAVARMNMLLGRRASATPNQSESPVGSNGTKVVAKETQADRGSAETPDESPPGKAKA